MLLPEEPGRAAGVYLIPIVAQIPSLLILLPTEKARKWRENFFLKHLTLGIMAPGAAQLLVIFLGGIIMESLELEAEETAHQEFVDWMRHANKTAPSLYPELVSRLGDPEAQIWRNWDVFGSTFYCFTLMTTIGYGTFAPSTAGGKIFSCFFALFAIPFAAYTYSNLGESITMLLFHWILVRRSKRLEASWPAFQPGETLAMKEEVLRWLDQSRIRVGRQMIEEHIDATLPDDRNSEQSISLDDWNELKEQVLAIFEDQAKMMFSIALLLFFISLTSLLYPLLEQGPAEDGFYWTIITFTTIGLGDKTLNYANNFSLHGQFDFNLFLVKSVGLALVASLLNNIKDVAVNFLAMARTEARTARTRQSRKLTKEETGQAVSPVASPDAGQVTGVQDQVQELPGQAE